MFVCILNISYAQNDRSIEKRKKELIEKEEQRKAEEMQYLEEMRSNHMAIQSKDTRKRMKKSKRKSKRVNDNRGTFILKRWYLKLFKR